MANDREKVLDIYFPTQWEQVAFICHYPEILIKCISLQLGAKCIILRVIRQEVLKSEQYSQQLSHNLEN